VTGLRIDGGSKWRVAGLRIGDPLGRVTEANGGPFQLYGFAWDYGGYVSDWRGGNLADALSDCQLSVRFSPAANAPVAEAIMGDREISSALPELGPARPRISQLAIAFAQDAGE
jgi:nucleoid-associated protein YgaU